MISKFVKIQAVVSYMLSVDKLSLTRFTRDFIEDNRELDKTVYNIFEAEVKSILGIMRLELVDYTFLSNIKQILDGDKKESEKGGTSSVIKQEV